MTNQAAIFEDVEANIRWREWRARGDRTDRRLAMRMRGLMLLIVIALAVWTFVQLA
jgi:hypothetical protein